MTDGGKLARGKVAVEVSAEKNQYIMNIQHIQFTIQPTKGNFCCAYTIHDPAHKR